MEQRPGRQQVALVQHALGQHVGVHARFHPAEQPRRFGGKAATCLQRQLHAARARLGQAQAHALGMAAQLALVDAQGQRLLQDGRCGQGGQQFGVEQALHQIGWRRQVAHAPVGRQDFGETAHIDGAPQAVEHRQPRGVLGRDVAVGVVFHHMKVVLLCQLQHLVRTAGRQAIARGIVEHAHAHEQLRGVGLAIARHHGQIGPVGAARHGQDVHAQGIQARKLHRPTGLLDHHRVAGPQQRAADDVERMGGAHRGHDLPGPRGNAQARQLARQHLAQAGVAHGFAILQRALLQRPAAGDFAHRRRHEARLQPIGREHARAGLRMGGRLVEHAPDQRRGVDARTRWQRPRARGHPERHTRYILYSCLRLSLLG